MAVSELNRRHLLAGIAAGAFLAPMPGFALTDSEARTLVDQVVADINRAINAGQSMSSMYNDFEQIFRRYADISTISRSVLGPPARSASEAELKAFSDSFISYIARKYGSRFHEFNGSEIKVTGTREVKSFVEVTATVQLRGQPPFAVSFMVSDRSGKDLFFDLLIEGISLLKAERSEIGALFDKQGRDVGKLTAHLDTIG